jgi:hypothetical protein
MRRIDLLFDLLFVRLFVLATFSLGASAGCGGTSGLQTGNTCGTINASDYDQTCKVDADCVTEPGGDFCRSQICTNCVSVAISVKAQSQYEVDLASKIPTPSICPCPAGHPAVCNQGVCTYWLTFVVPALPEHDHGRCPQIAPPLATGADDPENTLPLRGGMDIGTGAVIGGQLYSAALKKAVVLEKKAEFPRILIGVRMREYVESMAETEGGDMTSGYIRALMAGTLGSLFVDP